MVEGRTKVEDASSSSSSTTTASSGSGDTTKKGKYKRCIGLICFDDDDYLDIKVDKKENPECAELVDKFIRGSKKVRFTLEEDIDIEVREKD